MRLFAILALAAAIAAGSAWAGPGNKPDKAGPPGKGKSMERTLEKAVDEAIDPGKAGKAGYKGQGGGVMEEVADAVFTEVERRLIRDYYGGTGEGPGKSKTMPPGLARRDELPPGLQRHIEKYGTLPPGLEGRALPDDLLGRLPKRKGAYDRRILGTDVVLIERATGVILDILDDVVTPQ